MTAGSAIIIVGGVGLAAYLYIRSQNAQADALAAAQSAPGPGFLGRFENLGKAVAKTLPTAANNLIFHSGGWFSPTSIATGEVGNVAKTASHVATSVVGAVKGIF